MKATKLAGLAAWLPTGPTIMGTDRTPRRCPCSQCGGDLTLAFLTLGGSSCKCQASCETWDADERLDAVELGLATCGGDAR